MAFFPSKPDIGNLASIPDEHWEDVAPNQVNYSSKELGTKEAKQSMRELYTLLSEKVYGIDEVLDDIISSDVPF